ncbi:PTS transporter subunit IIC [Aeromonas sp. MdU4]|uniref:PTS transporter subunit IIC n=1 Tax=Aeromonas sp. MdU4 TaxID=3342819 RepID=UPI0035BAFE55
MDVIQYILGFGPAVVIPIIMFVFAVIFGARLADAAKNAMTVGIGFLGLSLLIGFMVSSLSSSTEAMVKNLNLHYEVLDLGWPLISAFSLAALSLPVVYALCFVTNLIMISTNTTKTLNVDFWNYWHFVFAGIIVEQVTGSFWTGIFASWITFVITLKIADYIAPHVQKFCDTPNVTITQAEIVAWAPLAFLMDRIIDRIPVINKIDLNLSKIEAKLGFFGSPLAMGAILGIVIGVLGALPFSEIIKSGMNFAAVMVLLPTMAGVLVSGLVPITEIASIWVKKRFPTKSLYFGISGEIAFKNPAVLSVGILMVPLTILISTVLPFNTMMPFADIPYLPIFVVFGTVACNGNMFRGLINGIVIVCGILWFGSDLAVVSQALAEKANLNVPKEMMASSIDGGSHAISYIFYKMFELLNTLHPLVLSTLALVTTCIIVIVLRMIFNIKKEYVKVATLATKKQN